jgi:DNA-binding protein H-NS
MPSLEDLIKQREELEAKIKNIKQSERDSDIVLIKSLIEKHALVAQDLFLDISIKVDPKYVNPETGETWAGRGKTPKWLLGKDKTQFEIGKV